MTREDAIKTLKELWRETNDPWYEEVYNMAINALEADRKTEPIEVYNGNADKENWQCITIKSIENESQTNNDFKVTYTCSSTDCDNFKNFGFSKKCIECKCKQSEIKREAKPQTERPLPDYSYEADLGRRIMKQTERSK